MLGLRRLLQPRTRATTTAAVARVDGVTPLALSMEIGGTVTTEGLGPYFRSRFRQERHWDVVNSNRYVGLVPLITTYAFLPGFPAPMSGTGQHIFELVPEHMQRAAAEGRCILVFDASPEGDPFLSDAYDSLHRWLDERGIPRDRVLILNQSRVLGRQYEAHYGPGVQFAVYDSYVKKMLAIFGRDEDGFRAAVGFGHDQVVFRGNGPRMKTFLCLNGAPRVNRIVAVAAMAQQGLLKDAEWSMLGDMSKKIDVNADNARTFRSANGIDWVSDEDIYGIVAQMPRLISVESSALSGIRGSDELALKINPDLYLAGFGSVATETEFTTGDVQRISELSIKPFVMGHPTILVGNPGSLALIRGFGFQTFGEFIDESYDVIPDINGRLVHLMKTMKDFQILRHSNNPKVMGRIGELCTFNIQHARSGAAVRRYEEAVETPLVDKLQDMLADLP